MMSSGPNELRPALLPSAPPAGERADSGYEDDADEGGGLDIRRYLFALLRHKWLILGMGALGFAAGAGATKLVKPMYLTQATIAIDAATRASLQGSAVQNVQLLESRAWLDLLRSFQVLDEVVRRRRLYLSVNEAVDPSVFSDFSLLTDFSPGNYRISADESGSTVTLSLVEGQRVSAATVGDSLGREVGFSWSAPRLRPGQSIEFTVRRPRDAAVRLGGSLQTFMPPGNASFMGIQLAGHDPAETAATMNALVERFVELATLLKREKLTYSAEILRDQLARAYAALQSAESALEVFKVATITEPSERGSTQISSGLIETRDPQRQAFFQLRIDRDALARDRDAVQRALLAASDSGALLLVSLGAIPSVAVSAELTASLADLAAKRAEARSLSVGFSSTHPPLRLLEQQIAELETRTIPSQAASLIANLDSRVSEFDQRIAASSREMQAIPLRTSDQMRLERDLTIAQNIYTQLRVSYEQASLAERSASPDVRVLDRAEPPTTPMTDRLLMIVAAGLAGGLGLGVLIALALDHFDKRLRYPEQVTRELGLTILGALPLVRQAKNGEPLADDGDHLVEALRSVRMSLVYAHGHAGPFITTVTSPGAGDGKSFVSMNLARSFASSGHRTLLIDGDTRRGRLHSALGIERRPGLLDYLAGTASREQVLRRVASSGIDVITCGTRSAGGPELLASSQMAQLIMSLRAEYSAIIIDSPPLGAGVDPLVLGALSGSLVMVLRSGVTDKELAGARLHDVGRLPIRVLGAVLNDVKATGVYRYYSYLPGYRADDEIVETPKRRVLLGRG